VSVLELWSSDPGCAITALSAGLGGQSLKVSGVLRTEPGEVLEMESLAGLRLTVRLRVILQNRSMVYARRRQQAESY
jgi:hypothetical protein